MRECKNKNNYNGESFYTGQIIHYRYRMWGWGGGGGVGVQQCIEVEMMLSFSEPQD